jgi:hypothetical protein
MSQNLYIESIAEARQLREIAEANARNKIIDAITPQIRKLIEKTLLNDDSSEDETPESSELIMKSDDDSGDLGLEPSEPNPRTTDIEDMEDSEDEPESMGASGAAQINVDDGHITLKLGDVEVVVKDNSGDEIQKLKTFEGVEDRATSGSNLKSTAHRAKIFEMKCKLFNIMLEKEIRRGLSVSDKEKLVQILETLQRQAVKLKSDAILTEGGSKVIKNLDKLIKEMKMSRKRMNNNVFDFLFEMDANTEEGMNYAESAVNEADEVEDEEDPEMPEDEESEGEEPEGEESALDTDEIAKRLEDLLDAIRGNEKGDEKGDDLKLGEGTLYEIDEAVLRRELRRMKRLSEATSGVEDPDHTARAFGGGDVEDEMFIDVDEETLLNVLADELGRVKFKGGRMHESAPRRAVPPQRNNETAALRSKLREYETMTESMKAQLVEMNLFNAKLLYANKLMQNKNLTQKQQRAIVEALDNAKTLREAKLLYKSLTESLSKGSARSLQEGSTRTLGSASRSTQSAQVRPTSNGVEVDRWAVLAGIASKK